MRERESEGEREDTRSARAAAPRSRSAPRAQAAPAAKAAGLEPRGGAARAGKAPELDPDAPSAAVLELLEEAAAPGGGREHLEAAAVLLLADYWPEGRVARLLGVTRATLREWRAENPVFDELWAEAVTLGRDEWVLWQQRRRMVRNDTTAGIVALKMRKLFTEDRGGGVQVQVNVGHDRPMAALTDEQLRAIVAVADQQEAVAALPAPGAAPEAAPGAGSPVPRGG